MPSPERREHSIAPVDPTRVTVADLSRIEAISALLSTLNDPSAGADALARHVASIPVLEARVSASFAQRNPNRKGQAIAQKIALLGNRALEAILLELLEDIVILHSDVEPPKPQGH